MSVKVAQNVNVNLGQIACAIGIDLPIEAPSITLHGLAPLESAKPTDLSFCTRTNATKLAHTRCGAVLTTYELAKVAPCFAFGVKNPRLALAQASGLFAVDDSSFQDIDCRSSIAKDVQLGDGVSIGAGAIIQKGAVLADGVRIASGAVVGEGVHLGSHTHIGANVVLHAAISVGKRCHIHAGVIIGADGFGFEQDESGKWHKIHQLGGVQIGDDVEIGANTTIDCGTFSATRIGNGVKIDNLVQIGHNVIIGDNCLIVGGSMISGHVEIGEGCILGGKNGITPGEYLAPGTVLTSGALLNFSIKTAGVYTGLIPAKPRREWLQFLKRSGYFNKVK